MESERVVLHVGGDVERGTRADAYLAEHLDLPSRAQLQQRLQSLTINGSPARPARRLRVGDRIVAELAPPEPLHVVAEPVPFPVVAEEAEFLVVDKPTGLVVHPGAGNRRGTLVNGLAWRYRDSFASHTSDDAMVDLRPGIVHRLDKDTSGVMIVARTARTHAHLVAQFAERRVAKRYIALVHGVPASRFLTIDGAIGRDPRDRIRFAVIGDLVVRDETARTLPRRLQAGLARDAAGRAPHAPNAPQDTQADPTERRPVPRGARPAISRVELLRRIGDVSLVMLSPVTGRTHQLRVHLAAIGTPIVGDPLYGPRGDGASRLMLHAWSLELEPVAGGGRRRFMAAVPPGFIAEVSRARSG